MANPFQQASIPQVTLNSGCYVVFEAEDASTGAAVTGVTIANVALYGVNSVDDDTPPLPELSGPSLTVEELNAAPGDA